MNPSNKQQQDVQTCCRKIVTTTSSYYFLRSSLFGTYSDQRNSLSLSLSQKVPAKDKATPGSTNDNRNKQLLKEKKQKKSTKNTEHIIHAKNLEHPDLQPKKSTAMATNPSKKTAAEQD
jgi:hypothetical protein